MKNKNQIAEVGEPEIVVLADDQGGAVPSESSFLDKETGLVVKRGGFLDNLQMRPAVLSQFAAENQKELERRFAADRDRAALPKHLAALEKIVADKMEWLAALRANLAHYEKLDIVEGFAEKLDSTRGHPVILAGNPQALAEFFLHDHAAEILAAYARIVARHQGRLDEWKKANAHRWNELGLQPAL